MTLTVAGLVVAVVVAVLTAAGIAAGAVWFLSGRIDTLSGRIDSSRAEVLTQVRQLDAKNEAAHAGIVARIDLRAPRRWRGRMPTPRSSTRLRTTSRSWRAARRSATTRAAGPEPARKTAPLPPGAAVVECRRAPGLMITAEKPAHWRRGGLVLAPAFVPW